MTARIVVATNWDAQLPATREVTPAHAHAALVTWEQFPDVDGGVPRQVEGPLSLAMASLGEVCFRLSGDTPPGARLFGTVKAGWSPFAPARTVIGSRDPEVVRALFSAEWAQGSQTALVGASSDMRVTQLLEARRLDGLTLQAAEITFSAIVDGAGMLIAAADSAPLDRAIEAVKRQCRDAGIAVSR